MPTLSDASAIYAGSSPATAVYVGAVQVWPSSGTITHGSQVTTANTGYAAWFDTGLGRNLTLSDLTVVGGTHLMSDFYTSGTEGSPTLVYGIHFTGSVRIDVDWITFRGCLFDNPPTEFINPDYHFGVTLDYCSVDPADVGPYGMGDAAYSINRCYIRGNSDGLRINGGVTDQHITESWIRVKMADGGDHNDNLQNFGGSGNIYIERCNLDLHPEGGIIAGAGGPDGCVLSADLTSATVLHLEVNDCLLNGAGISTLRFYDGALSSSITYAARGNRFVRNASNPVHRGTVNTTPTGQITWTSNVWDDDGSSIPLV